MSDSFDACSEWLQIPVDNRPPSHYALLGLPDFEADPERIKAAFSQRLDLLHVYEGGKRDDHAQRLIRDLSAAYHCLSHAETKQAYDRQLQETIRRRTSADEEEAEVVFEAEAVLDDEPVTAEFAEPLFVPQPASVLTAAREWLRGGRGRMALGIAATGVALLLGTGAIWLTWSRASPTPRVAIAPPTPPEQPAEPPAEPGEEAADTPTDDPTEDSGEEPAPPAIAFESIRTLQGHTGALRAVALRPDGQQALTGSDDATAILWDVATGQPIHVLRGHTSAVTSVAISGDGSRLLTGSADKLAMLWDASSGERLSQFLGHMGGVTAVALTADGSQAITGSSDTQAILWQAATGQRLRVFDGHRGAVTCVALSPDGQQVLTGSADRTAMLWDRETGRRLGTFEGHEAAVLSVAFRPDGRYVLTGSADRTVRLWEATAKEPLRILRGHGDQISSVAFCADGQRLLSASRDKTAVLWEAATSRELFRFEGHDALASVSVTADMQRVLTASSDTTAIVWEVLPPPLAIAPFDEAVARQLQADWAAHLQSPAVIFNSIGMKLVLVPPGEFLMGSPDDDPEADSDEKPQHQVRITKPLYLGAYEVTQAEYQRVMGDNPSEFQEAGPMAPVENVSWEDAVSFCAKLSSLPEEQAAGRQYRLPTEAEWEFACRAGSTLRYGSDESGAELQAYAWFDENSGDTTHPVGEKKSNAWGLFDMQGNVFEWCHDWWNRDCYALLTTELAVDPSGPLSATLRVLRGGCCINDSKLCRPTYRIGYEHRSRYFGFRLAVGRS